MVRLLGFILDRLPKKKKFRYNFLSKASSLLNSKHTEEIKALISETKLGSKYTKETKANTNALALVFGTISVKALTVYVYSAVDNSLVTTYPSRYSVGKAYGVNEATIRKYIRSDNVFRFPNVYTVFSPLRFLKL